MVAPFAYAEQELNYHKRYFKMSMFPNVFFKYRKTSCTKTTENSRRQHHYSISAKAIDVRDDAVVIDGTGKTLTPGFIENHAHLIMAQAC
ncbi:hypothetical protein OH492_14650 [Vibrio chagasii]|nr:hypothetical protein [Vibrio chagasii]